jgi:glycosyltransferase involved in cell wall biosynthesis
MKIHLLTDSFTIGGGLEHIVQIIRGMPQVSFTVYGKGGSHTAPFSALKNVTLHPDGYCLSSVLEKKPDLIHIHHLRPLLAICGRPLRKIPVPLLFTVHGIHLRQFEYGVNLKKRIQYRLRFSLEKYLYQKASALIAVSREDADYLKHRFAMPQVKTILNGIDFDNIRNFLTRSNAPDIREELQIPKSTRLFTTLARFNYQKGQDILLEAVYLLKDFLKDQPIRFLLAGSGETWLKAKQQAKSRGIDHLIIFTGERTDNYRLISQSDYFVLPSRWEGLPISVLEAGLLKIPVIASDGPGNKELLSNNRGILFHNEDSRQLANCLQTVITHPPDHTALTANLFSEITANYSLQGMLENLFKLYSSLARH